MKRKNVRYGARSAPAVPGARAAQPQPAQKAPVAAPQQAAAPAPTPATKPNVTPQQQAIYNGFVNDCYRILFNPQAFPATLKMIMAHGTPAQGVAQAVVMVALQVEEGYQKSGKPITPTPILVRGALELLRTLIQVAQQAKVHTFSQNDFAQAIQLSVSMYSQQATKLGILSVAQAQKDQAQLPQNPVFAPVLAPGELPDQVAAARKSKVGNTPAAPTSAAPTPTTGLLSQGQ